MKYLKRASCHVTGRRRCQSIPGFSELQKILSTPQQPPHFSWEKSFLRQTVSIGPGTKRTNCPLQFYLYFDGDHHHRNKSRLYLSDKHPTHRLNEIKYSEKCLILKVLFAEPGGRRQVPSLLHTAQRNQGKDQSTSKMHPGKYSQQCTLCPSPESSTIL